MKKIFVILPILAGILLLAGCQSDEENLNFYGSSDNWTAEIITEIIDGAEKNEIILKYNGDGAGTISKFNYLVENNSNNQSFGANDVSLKEDGTYTNANLASNSASTTKDDQIEVTIDWNDQTESIILKKKE